MTTLLAAPSRAPLRVQLIPTPMDTAWDRFVAADAAGHLLQSWAWGAFKAGQGWQPARLGVRRPDGALVAAAQVLFRRPVPHTPVAVAYVPRGPVASLAGLHALCRRRGAIFLKIEPNVPAGAPVARALAAAGFQPARRVQPSRTLLLDLQPDQPEETLLAAMKPKTRYNIRLAQRRGVTVRPAAGAADLQQFYDLLVTTGQRDAFAVHSLDYYRAALDRFAAGAAPDAARPVATLLLAEHPDGAGAPLAGLLAFAFGAEAIYMYGASADRGREHMPAYLLQWAAMGWARARGCRRYDFWGIPDHPEAEAPAAGENPNVRQGLWGVYRFKQGFGGVERDYAGAWDFVYRPLAYRLYQHYLRRTGREE